MSSKSCDLSEKNADLAHENKWRKKRRLFFPFQMSGRLPFKQGPRWCRLPALDSRLGIQSDFRSIITCVGGGGGDPFKGTRRASGIQLGPRLNQDAGVVPSAAAGIWAGRSHSQQAQPRLQTKARSGVKRGGRERPRFQTGHFFCSLRLSQLRLRLRLRRNLFGLRHAHTSFGQGGVECPPNAHGGRIDQGRAVARGPRKLN